ncbi:hypothetical protein Bca101_026910 [Brassica carinata]
MQNPTKNDWGTLEGGTLCCLFCKSLPHSCFNRLFSQCSPVIAFKRWSIDPSLALDKYKMNALILKMWQEILSHCLINFCGTREYPLMICSSQLMSKFKKVFPSRKSIRNTRSKLQPEYNCTCNTPAPCSSQQDQFLHVLLLILDYWASKTAAALVG